MAQKIIKIGKSVGITIPKQVLNEMKLSTGDMVSVSYNKRQGSLIVKRTKGTMSDRQAHIAKLTHDFVDRYRKDLEALAKK